MLGSTGGKRTQGIFCLYLLFYRYSHQLLREYDLLSFYASAVKISGYGRTGGGGGRDGVSKETGDSVLVPV